MSLKQIFLSFMLIGIIPLSLFAQGGPPATPIDGGLSFLLVAGGAYGIKKLIKPKNDQ